MSSNPFNEVEKGLLIQLSSNEVWQSILDKLRRDPLPEYKPTETESETTKLNRWIYESGRKRENGELISILKLEMGV